MNYPNDIPIFELEGHGGLSLSKADELYQILLEAAYDRKHQTMIYDLVVIAKEFISNHFVKEESPKVYPFFDFIQSLIFSSCL